MSSEQPISSSENPQAREFDGYVYTAEAGHEKPDVPPYVPPGRLPPAAEGFNGYLKLFTGIDLQPLLTPKQNVHLPQQRSAVEVGEIVATTFDDIGGHTEAKRIMRRLAYGMRHPEIYKEHGTRPPKGILMHGPPGTGKTLLAKALAHEAGAPFYAPQVDEIADKWYGESEKKVKEIFRNADSHDGPAIVFIDELDALAPSRALNQGGPSQRIVSVLLNVLDGITPLKNVTVLAATNHVEAIDGALLRPGRFDRHIPISLPDREGLREIFVTNCMKAEQQAGKTLFDVMPYEEILDKMQGFSGADVAEIVRRVLDERLDAALEGQAPEGNVTAEQVLAVVGAYERRKAEARNAIGFGSTALSRTVQRPV